MANAAKAEAALLSSSPNVVALGNLALARVKLDAQAADVVSV